MEDLVKILREEGEVSKKNLCQLIIKFGAGLDYLKESNKDLLDTNLEQLREEMASIAEQNIEEEAKGEEANKELVANRRAKIAEMNRKIDKHNQVSAKIEELRNAYEETIFELRRIDNTIDSIVSDIKAYFSK